MKQEEQTLALNRENVVKAYLAGDNSVKTVLRTMFPTVDFDSGTAADNRPITERVKTFDDACRLVEGKTAAEWEEENETDKMDADVLAYLKLRIVCAALNEGWEPRFVWDEWRWYPWHYLYSQYELEDKDDEWKRSHALVDTGDYFTEYAGFAYANSSNAPSDTNAYVGSRLCLKSEALSDYCGTQFISLWADFKLRRRF